MKLNQLNLPNADVPAARAFFTNHFGFRPIDEKQNDTISVMRSDDDFTLVLMSEKQNQTTHCDYPDAFHVRFFLDGCQTFLWEGRIT